MKSLHFKTTALLFAVIAASALYADDYSNYNEWEHEDVVGVFVEISRYEAQQHGYDYVYEDGDDSRYFEKIRLSEGKYKVEVYEKIDSKFWGLHYSKYFLRFRYNPFLFRLDEGLLVWDGYDGVFYKKP